MRELHPRHAVCNTAVLAAELIGESGVTDGCCPHFFLFDREANMLLFLGHVIGGGCWSRPSDSRASTERVTAITKPPKVRRYPSLWCANKPHPKWRDDLRVVRDCRSAERLPNSTDFQMDCRAIPPSGTARNDKSNGGMPGRYRPCIKRIWSSSPCLSATGI